MTAPTPDPADVELVADAIARRHCWDGIAEVDAVAPANAESFRHDAEAVVAALGGRLVSPDADTRPTFGVRMTYDDGTVTEDECERSLADAGVRFHAERRQTKPGWRVVKAELIERTWRASPWVPVPTPPAPDLETP